MTSAIERGFVPLPKVEREQPEDNIRILLNLPDYVDQDRIGVNLAGIARLCRLGGIQTLIVIGNTGEETSHVIPEVVGLNSDGSAVASKKIAKVTVPTFETKMYDATWRNQQIASRWIRLNINMNIDEVALRVSEEQEGVHSVKNWTQELDGGFKVPIRRAGNQNLLHDLGSLDRQVYAGLGLITALFAGLELANNGSPDLGLDILKLGAAIAVTRAPLLIEALVNQNYRFSIFPGHQVDRAVALGILSRTKTLIKDLHPDKT